MMQILRTVISIFGARVVLSKQVDFRKTALRSALRTYDTYREYEEFVFCFCATTRCLWCVKLLSLTAAHDFSASLPLLSLSVKNKKNSNSPETTELLLLFGDGKAQETLCGYYFTLLLSLFQTASRLFYKTQPEDTTSKLGHFWICWLVADRIKLRGNIARNACLHLSSRRKLVRTLAPWASGLCCSVSIDGPFFRRTP